MRAITKEAVGVSKTPAVSYAENEIWKNVPGYEGRYQVSNYGRVKSLKRKVRSINHYTGNEFFRTVPEHILRPGQYSKSGHLSVVLEHGGNGQPVHQLIMKTFIGEPPEGIKPI